MKLINLTSERLLFIATLYIIHKSRNTGANVIKKVSIKFACEFVINNSVVLKTAGHRQPPENNDSTLLLRGILLPLLAPLAENKTIKIFLRTSQRPNNYRSHVQSTFYEKGREVVDVFSALATVTLKVPCINVDVLS